MPRAALVSVTHGGGPMPLLGDSVQEQLAQSMRTKVPSVLKLGTPEAPQAIVLVTAHWETDTITISSGNNPQLYYDYGGFPDAAYKFKYPAPGSRKVAELVRDALKEQGINSTFDATRGWDHGVFVPMMLVNPKADVPIVQVSVLGSQDPKGLYEMGVALAPLRDQNIAIIGSGSASFHNMMLLRQAMFNGIDVASLGEQEEWNVELDRAIMEQNESKRRENMLNWRKLKGSYLAHPRGGADHFSPLIVCAGAAGVDKARSWSDPFVGYAMHTYYWI